MLINTYRGGHLQETCVGLKHCCSNRRLERPCRINGPVSCRSSQTLFSTTSTQSNGTVDDRREEPFHSFHQHETYSQKIVNALENALPRGDSPIEAAERADKASQQSSEQQSSRAGTPSDDSRSSSTAATPSDYNRSPSKAESPSNNDTSSSLEGKASDNQSQEREWTAQELLDDPSIKLSWQELVKVDVSGVSRYVKTKFEAHLTPEDKEKLRRARISAQMKGRPTWNKGSAWSAETKERIQAGTRLAMKRPEVLARLRANHSPKTQTQATKDKISSSLKANASEKKLVRAMLDKADGEESGESTPASLQVRTASISELTRLMPAGILSKDKLAENASSKLLVEHFSPTTLNKIMNAAQNALARIDSESASNAEASGNESLLEQSLEVSEARFRSDSHRMKIAAAIRKKWEDPEYRTKQITSTRQKTQTRKPTAKQKSSEDGTKKPAAKSTKKASAASTASTGAKRKSSKKAKEEADQISSSMLDRLKEQELALLRKQNAVMRKQHQRMAKLNVAKELVVELESVLANLPSHADLGAEDTDMKQSIVEAQQLLAQAKSRVKALETPSSVRRSEAQPSQQSPSSEEQLQSAMVMLNMDE